MEILLMNETIAAIATAYGEGGVGIVRISGPDALQVLRKIFVCDRPIKNRRMTFGRVVDASDGHIIDEVLAVYMKAPGTYTGEDTVEINCHGSMVSLKQTLSLALKHGAIMAEPGEFTKRAFLNGRMDLSQAEAVIDVVKAKTDKSFDIAVSQLEGVLSREIKGIRQRLLDLLVDITVNIDYPDEDIEQLTYSKLREGLFFVREEIGALLESAGSGRMIRDGIRIAIVGKPNVGKSSLMNGLLKESRAIVTEVPGTTRDTIEETLNIRGIPVYLIDTAGIRHTEDIVEKIGIEKSKEAFNEADYIIFVIDGSSPLSDDDEGIMEYLAKRRSLVLINKQDMGNAVTRSVIKDRLPNCDVIETVLINGEGLELIEDKIEELVYGGKVTQKNSAMVNNVRHEELLRQAAKSLCDAFDMAGFGEALDIIEIDVRNAYDYLGEIIGETVNEDILNEVFSRFCLGK